jgi:stage III sporulation protein AA
MPSFFLPAASWMLDFFMAVNKRRTIVIYIIMKQMIDWTKVLEKYLPPHIHTALSAVSDAILPFVEELRLRSNRPLMIYTAERGYCVSADGRTGSISGLVVTENDIEQTFSAITGKSPYAYEDEIRQGFLTLSSGIRAGLSGSAMMSGDKLKTYKSVSGINFRIPREMTGICQGLLPYISDKGQLVNTLIISSPKLGKTTIARDIARSAGSGIGLKPCKVSLVDERQELAASLYGCPLFDVGRETDVISGVYKHIGVFMALRSLSPDVIVTDEIGRTEDLDALKEIANSGVVMIATAHAPDFESLLGRMFFKQLFEARLIDSWVVLSAALGRITVQQVHSAEGIPLLSAPFQLAAGKAVAV